MNLNGQTIEENEDDRRGNIPLSSPLLLNTVITIPSYNNPPLANSREAISLAGSTYVLDKFRASPITFEDYFSKQGIQRKFYIQLLYFQLVINILPTIGSIVCTILTDQKWFWFTNNEDSLLNSLMLHTGILSCYMMLMPFLVYHFRKLDGFNIKMKSILETFMKFYQVSLLTFWFAFVCNKIWNSLRTTILEEENGINQDDEWPPLFCLPSGYCILNFCNLSVMIILFRYTKISLSNLSLISIVLLTSTIVSIIGGISIILGRNRSNDYILLYSNSKLVWLIIQLGIAAFFAVMEGSLAIWTFKKTWQKKHESINGYI